MKESKGRKLVKRLLWITAGLIVVVAIGISLTLYVVFTPERLTPIVLKYANDNLNADLDCESVELTFYKTFPNFGIRLKNGRVLSGIDSLAGQPQDTLLVFRDFLISFNPIELYKNNHLVINRAVLSQPVIYAYVNQDGNANWNFLPENVADSTLQDVEIEPETATTTEQKPFAIDVKRVRIKDARIIYDDRQQSVFIVTDSLQLRATGTPTDVDLSLGVKALTVFYEDKLYSSKLPLTLAAHVKSDESYQQFVISKSSFSIGIMTFDATGSVELDTAFQRTKIDLDFNLHASSLADLLATVPSHILDIKQLSASGKLDFSGKVAGYFGEEQFPLLTVSLQLQNGAVINKKQPENPLIKQMDVDCETTIDMMKQIPSHINIKTLYLENASTKLNVSGMFADIFRHPFIDAKIHGDIDFNRLWNDLPFEKDMSMGGSVSMNISGNCALDDLLSFNYGKINAVGDMDINNVIFDYPQADINIFAPKAQIRLGSNVTDSIRGREIASLFRANVELDSLKLLWKNEMQLHAGKLNATFRTSAPQDSVSIAEMATFARLSNIQLTTADSVRIWATKIMASGKLAPLTGHPERPEWSARITLDSVRGRTPELFGGIVNTALQLNIHPRETRTRQQLRQTGEDSVRRRIRRDSLVEINRNMTAISFQLDSGETRDFLSNWDLSGSFTSTSISMRTPYFPLRTRLNESSVTFTADKFKILSMQLLAGESNIMMNGEIDGIRNALLRNGRVTAKVNIEADSINCNEIIRVLAAGSDYSEKSAEQQDSISQLVLNESLETEHTTDNPPSLFVVPRNIDVEFNARLKKVRYGQFNLDNADGNIIIRNQSVRIPNLHVQSDIGHVDLSMVYKAPTTKGAYTGLDIHMDRVYLKELIRSIPMLDSLTPILRTFEGLVECNITAVTELDSLSNVIIPKTTASCNINGKDMVLLDGETFSLIAKKLYFKNKNRNKIDSINVDLVLEDNKILVFPFVVSIDRYVAAIGGTQNMDMTFQYHISILKWPVPLVKIGLNIWGDPDNIKYSLASRKYTDSATPAKEHSLESTVINVRRQMHDNLRKSIDDILNESDSFRLQRPLINNDTLDTLFKLDTTIVNSEEVNSE